MKIRVTGTVEWNAAEDDIQSLTGKATFQESVNGRTQRIVFEPEQGGVKRTYTIDGTHSNAEFAVKHLMITTVKGRFGDVKGTVKIPDTGMPSADVTIATYFPKTPPV